MEARLFDPLNPPEWLDPLWWVDQPHVNHVDNRVHQARLNSAADTAAWLAEGRRDEYTICDIGSCDGGLLELIDRKYPFARAFGYDVIEASIKYGREVRGVDLRYGNVTADYSLPLAPVVVCTEMLEHLEFPHFFVTDLFLQSKKRGVEYVIFSSPHSETAEYHEWNHAWAWDREGYAKMITDAGWEIVSHTDVEWSQQIVAKNNDV
jgi:2-polyprenyl-3-methyl-5-hydroxy-6-metoxy-1,4-benzoquinol methylase